MNQTTQEPTNGAEARDGRLEGLVHVNVYGSTPAERLDSRISEPYEPCEGSWSEFVGDLKKSFGKMGADIGDRVESVREFWGNAFHRNRPNNMNHPHSI